MSQTLPTQTTPAEHGGHSRQGCCSDRVQSQDAKRGVESQHVDTPADDEPAGSCCNTTFNKQS